MHGLSSCFMRPYGRSVCHETARQDRHQQHADGGAHTFRNCRPIGCAGIYHPVIHSSQPECPQHETMPTVRKTGAAAQGAPGEEILLGSLPDGLVEQPPGCGRPKGLLHAYLRILRKGVRKLWQQKPKILLPRLLYFSPTAGINMLPPT